MEFDDRFMPDPSLSRDEMEKLQRELAETAVFDDAFPFNPEQDDVLVAGIDQAFRDDKAISGIVVQEWTAASQSDSPETVDRAHAVVDLEIPYIPGLLAFREGEAILAAYERLSVTPDLLVVDGSGRIHFREAGIATHIGVMTDVPSVGVAKNLLCGRPEHSLEEKMEQGARVAILADDSVETAAEREVIGYAFQSKQYTSGNRKVNPLYISAGHRVSDETAVDFVERLGGDYKLPEPTRLADAYVDDVKQALTDDDQESLDTF